ncbi:MAG: DUF5677 domain-containing protein [Humidesulfovibrio sp.]
MEIRAEVAALVDCLTGAHAKLRMAFDGLRIEGQDLRTLLLLLKFQALYSDFADFLVLYKIKRDRPALYLIRTILECYADILNLSNEDGYSERLFYSANLERKKMLSGACEIFGYKRADIDSEIARLDSKIAEAKSKKIIKLQVKDKFVLAKLCKHYSFVYVLASSLTHADCYTSTIGCDTLNTPLLDLHHRRKPFYDDGLVLVKVLTEAIHMSASKVVQVVDTLDANAYHLFEKECLEVIGRAARIEEERRKATNGNSGTGNQ